MARPLRIEFTNAYYHVMNRGLEHRKIALANKDYDAFLKLIADIAQRWQVKIFAYCLMDNHYHLFLQTPQGNLSRVMRHLDGLYTQYFNRTYKRDGPLFRGRYRAILVDADTYLLGLVRYIHFNPVKAKKVKKPEDFTWCSHHLYLTSTIHNYWLAKDEILSFFPNAKSFHEFVIQGNDSDIESFYKRKRSTLILGKDSFISSILKLKRLSKEKSYHSRSDITPQFPDLVTLVKKVSKTFKVDVDYLLVGEPGQENMARNIAIYIASRKVGFPHADIRNTFGLGSDSAVSRVCQRFEQRARENENIKHMLHSLLYLKEDTDSMCQVKT